VAKPMINSHLVAIRIVRRGSALREIVCHVTNNGKIRFRRVRLKELLHRRKDQRLWNLETWRANALVLPFLRINRQRIPRSIAAKLVPDKDTGRGLSR